MQKSFRVLAINPGSTSTKIAVYHNEECTFEAVIRHSADDLKAFARINEQYDFRRSLIETELSKQNIQIRDLDAVVGRGGPLKPIDSGTYIVNEAMCQDLRTGIQAEHASNLGGLIARGLADQAGIPAYIVDPVSVDEFEPFARISGIPEIKRRSLFHALNLKAVAHRVANDLGREYASLTLILVHLGGGISVGIQRNGKMIDVANANEEGPFSPERAGSIPAGDLVKMCFSGHFTLDEMKAKLVGKGGMVAHLGTTDARVVEERIHGGDKQAELIYQTMAYQIAKEIGSMSTVVGGKFDGIVLTGGLAYSQMLVNWIQERVAFLGTVLVYPGEDELQALAEGAIRVLSGLEQAKIYE